MTSPDPAPVRANRPTRRRHAIRLTAAAFASAALALAIPGSPLYLPTLLTPKATHEGRHVSYWLGQLDNGDPTARDQAIFALGAIGSDAGEAVPALVGILEQGDDNARSQAAFALTKMAPASRAAVPALTKALADDTLMVRMNAASALARLGPEAHPAIPALIQAIDDDTNQTNLGAFHHTIQERMVLALGRASAGSGLGVPTLIGLAKGEGTETLRATAVRVLGEVGAEARPAVPVLKELLTDNSPDVRENAERALASLGERPD